MVLHEVEKGSIEVGLELNATEMCDTQKYVTHGAGGGPPYDVPLVMGMMVDTGKSHSQFY